MAQAKVILRKIKNKCYREFCGARAAVLRAHYTRLYKKSIDDAGKEYRLADSPRRDGREKITVSLTTIPSRADTVWLSIESIFRQSLPPDRIVLYLSKEQFQGIALPAKLLAQKERGLVIRYTEDDLRSHKKYFYAMKEYPDDLIITVDDDIFYRKNMIALLVNSFKRYPNAVSCMRAHKILFDGEKIKPYRQWGYESPGGRTPSGLLLATTGAGTLYPPHCMPAETFECETFRRLCFSADDIWMKIMELRAGIPVVKAVRGRGGITMVERGQKECLSAANVITENDVCIRRLTEYYGIEKKDFMI